MPLDADVSIEASDEEHIRENIISCKVSQIRCTLYSCKIEGPDKGPKYNFNCDYIDCWGQSSAYNPDFIDDKGKMKEDVEVILAVKK